MSNCLDFVVVEGIPIAMIYDSIYHPRAKQKKLKEVH